LAEGLREAYSDLFELNVNAQKMSRDEVKNKLKTLTQGQFSDNVLGKMASTFVALAAEADWEAVEPAEVPDDQDVEEREVAPAGDGRAPPVEPRGKGLRGLGGLVYNIQIQLPESRDPAVYDALFRSLKTHLLNE
jgi:hypothetical protein